MPPMNDKVQSHLSRLESVLQSIVVEADIPAKRIQEAMYYALFPGGKRLRPKLVYLCGDLLQVSPETLDIIAAAIELTHCYSLIHDDLPAMDNDDFRRGRPSCHRAFDEATAILVGDGMQALAIDILLKHLPKTLTLSQTIDITQELIFASGPSGMVSGQSLDLSELAKPGTSEEQLKIIHELKTGRLIQACIHMVLIAANPSPDQASALKAFARHLGLVFQMQDDYLDKYGHTAILGKARASDTANDKTTFASLYDKEQLSHLIHEYYENAASHLGIFSHQADAMLQLIDGLRQRMLF